MIDRKMERLRARTVQARTRMAEEFWNETFKHLQSEEPFMSALSATKDPELALASVVNTYRPLIQTSFRAGFSAGWKVLAETLRDEIPELELKELKL